MKVLTHASEMKLEKDEWNIEDISDSHKYGCVDKLYLWISNYWNDDDEDCGKQDDDWYYYRNLDNRSVNNDHAI